MRARSMRTVAVVLALLLAALAAWWFTSPADDAPRAPSAADRAAASEPAPLPALEPQPRVPPPAEPSSAAPAWASGVVVDEAGAPIVGARVLARTRRELGGRRVAGFLALDDPPLSITGADGRFRVEHAPAHFEALAVLADGFEATERPDLSTEAGASHDLKFTLSRGRRLAGSVRDTEGRPISRARVSLTARSREGGWVPPLSALTDREGTYSFLGLPKVLDLGMVAALGYQSSNGFLDASGWGERKDFTLARSALLVDAVEADGGAPIDGARGTLWLGKTGVRSGVLEPWRHRAEALWPDAPGRLELFLDWVYPPLTDSSLDGEALVFAEGYRSARARLTLQKGVEPPHLRVALARERTMSRSAGWSWAAKKRASPCCWLRPRTGPRRRTRSCPPSRPLPPAREDASPCADCPRTGTGCAWSLPGVRP
jgi:hypothetical protein